MRREIDTNKKAFLSYRTVALAFVALMLAANSWSQGFETQVETLSAALGEQIAKAGKKSVAVVDFTDLQGSVTELGKFLAEEFSAALAGSRKGFAVVDRNNLRLILEEQKLATTGLVDPATIQKLGQIAGVETLVTGTLTPFGDTVRVSLKILDTATAKVIGAARGDIPKTKAVEELLARGVAATGPGQAAAAPKPAAPPAVHETTVSGLVFRLEQCKASGDSLRCSGTVTSQENNQTLKLYGRGYSKYSRAVDTLGNEYTAGPLSLGAYSSSNYARADLVSQVPMRFTLTFEGFPVSQSHLAMLELVCEAGGKDFSAVFRNIAVVH